MTILQEADGLINGERQRDYGDPADNYSVIADLMSAYLRGRGHDVHISAADAAQLMLLVKIGRASTGRITRDTLVDQAGYAGLTARILEMDP